MMKRSFLNARGFAAASTFKGNHHRLLPPFRANISPGPWTWICEAREGPAREAALLRGWKAMFDLVQPRGHNGPCAQTPSHLPQARCGWRGTGVRWGQGIRPLQPDFLSSTPTTTLQELALLKDKRGFDFQTSLFERTSCFLSELFKTDECSPREKAAVNTGEGRKGTLLGVPEEPSTTVKRLLKRMNTPHSKQKTQFPVKVLSEG